jgi:metal-responsive CopG/Arc/MetJ family transcriptional regulator
MSRKNSENKVKVQISVDRDVLDRIDDYCNQHYMSRSGFLAFSASQVISSEETVKLLKQMNGLLSRVAETGKMDDQTRADLDKLSRVVALFGSRP